MEGGKKTEVKMRKRNIKLESEGIKTGKYRGITKENSNIHILFVRGAEQVAKPPPVPQSSTQYAKLRGCVRRILGQRPIHGPYIEYGYHG